MYVCICNGYRDSDIRQLAQSGVRCAHVAYESLGSGPRCGRCVDVAQRLIDQIHQDRDLPDNQPTSASVGADRAALPNNRGFPAGRGSQKPEPRRYSSAFATAAPEHADIAKPAALLVVEK